MASDLDKTQAAAVSEKASSAELENGATGVVLDAETNKRLLKRIDWYVESMPFNPLYESLSYQGMTRCSLTPLANP